MEMLVQVFISPTIELHSLPPSRLFNLPESWTKSHPKFRPAIHLSNMLFIEMVFRLDVYFVCPARWGKIHHPLFLFHMGVSVNCCTSNWPDIFVVYWFISPHIPRLISQSPISWQFIPLASQRKGTGIEARETSCNYFKLVIFSPVFPQSKKKEEEITNTSSILRLAFGFETFHPAELWKELSQLYLCDALFRVK